MQGNRGAISRFSVISNRANLTRRYGSGLIFDFSQKPGLLGGLRVQIGSDVFDGSVQARLAALDTTF
ncbi:MAG: F0F1 ATP synthase subunit delta [Verrucomicrobia bacterium]|nr:F0F1 ATP synthase subunit delta [Verrucomicrobiota bacterium]